MSAPAATALIANAGELAGRGMSELRELALRVAGAGLAACDVGLATEAAVRASNGSIEIAGRAYPLADDARVIVVGSGKATLAIAAALERRLGARLDGGAVVVRDGEDTIALERIEVLVADHPLPSERSIAGARRLAELAAGVRAGDLVLASFTGGSSALTSLPPPGVTGDEKRRLHELLLASGAPITEINAVRKHVSGLKGGRLAARIAPATLVNLTASDVAGDILDAITDPTVQDGSTVAEAVAILRERGLWDDLPESVQRHLASPEAESPRLGREPHTVLLVTGRSACEAMALEARAAGAVAQVVSTELEGEAQELGRMLAALAREAGDGDGSAASPRVLVGCGGEATVSLGRDGTFGDGGPNQEAAVAAALALGEGAAVSACFLDTDGSDGGTEAAGGIVDGHTVVRAARGEIDLEAALAEHRSGEALAELGDRVITGPTQTNVNDLFVVAVGPAEASV
ncbi:MAG: gck [Solirubrobacterales bacterium]|nr:gck [Solirubrobacterales bacterium]